MLKSRFAGSREGRAYYHGQFLSRGVSPERLVLDAFVDYDACRDRYQAIDISLDTIPHSGGASGWDPLWQGVPLVTLDADRFCSRWGSLYVDLFGHPEWSAKSEAEYVAIAADLASDVSRLAAWRPGMRERFAGLSWSAAVASIEQIYREIVRDAGAAQS
jgi:predicted O-linked N-acetylglucosamine transferase (SPINDLY family)